jgi:aspartate aminotransferase
MTLTDMFSTRIARAAAAAAPIIEFVDSPLARRAEDPRTSNFLFGNPQEMPLASFTASLHRWAEPRHKDWFAYQTHVRTAQQAVADTLRDRYGLPFLPDDIALTTGAFGGLSMLLNALTEAGDEVVIFTPPWFFYEAMTLFAGATPVRVVLRPPAFDLDPDELSRVVTPRTRAVILNSAQNPTGRVYSPDVLRRLAAVLEKASAANGRPIYLFSDEAYSRIVYGERRFETPTAFYPFSFLVYTYGKVLLTPGQRIGYVAIAPGMPGRETLRYTFVATQMIQGWTFPNALMQYTVPDLEGQSIDIRDLERKRDRLVGALRDAGYQVESPEATFYLLARAPIADDRAFCGRLAEHDILCMPGSVFEAPGYFRVSMTANDQMIDRAIPGFRAARAG